LRERSEVVHPPAALLRAKHWTGRAQSMADSKLKIANRKVWVELNLGITLHKSYGESVKAVATTLANVKAGKASEKDVKTKCDEAKKNLKDLLATADKLEQAMKELDKELQRTPLNGPEAALAKEATENMGMGKGQLVISRRAEEYFKKEYPTTR
jgi:cell division protein FtsB